MGSTPTPKPADPMPDENDPGIAMARRKITEDAMRRSGRASTMLSDSYSADKLGGK